MASWFIKEGCQVKKYTKKEYGKMVERSAPKTSMFQNLLWAFFIGGAICVVGQLISQYFRNRGWSIENVASGTSIIMVFLGALFTGLGLYDKLAKFAGAGTIVPITGFANAIVSPAMEFKREGYILGVAGKMFVVAGPVLVYGITTSVIAGVIYYLIR
ncbi:MAG: stage V sporulation protein AC [Hyphomonadaceae bacterium]|nr:stage V sporulation protein AC [Clostridia bacterium]